MSAFLMNNGPCTTLRQHRPRVTSAVSSGKAYLQHKKPLCCRCYLPVLTGLAESPLHRAHTLITTYAGTDRKRPSLGEEFNLTIADCELQGTASSPSSTVRFIAHD